MYNPETYVAEVTTRAKTLSKLFSKWFNIQNVEGLSRKSRLPPRFINFVREAWQALEDIYPGRGDIQFELEPEFSRHTNTYGSNHIKEFIIFSKFKITKIYLVVRFPEITIRNSRRGKLDLKDLFIRIPVTVSHGSRGGMEFMNPEGARSTISISEYSSGYAHSHLTSIGYSRVIEKKNKSTICWYSGFCLGSGDIVSMLSQLNADYDIDYLRLLIHHLETYVSWESIEGNPFIRLSNAVEKSYSYNKVSLSDCQRIYDAIKSKMQIRDSVPNINWKLKNGAFEIIDDERFEQMFRDTLEVRYYNGYLIYKDIKGEYFTSSATEIPEGVVGTHPDYWLPFKGEKFIFTVNGNRRMVDSTTPRYINPIIKNYVKSRLEQQANTSKIREAGIRRGNIYDNPR